MIIEAHNPIPVLTQGEIQQYVATHEFNEIGEREWFRLIPYGEDLFRTPKYDFVSGTQLTTGDVLWIAVGLNKGYQARPYSADPTSTPGLGAMH
ncbi:hypothetical protein GCM10028819_06750 [Spirosoma humi]